MLESLPARHCTASPLTILLKSTINPPGYILSSPVRGIY